MAKSVQSLVHALTGSSQPKGWQYQIKSQFTLDAAFEYEARLFGTDNWDQSVFSQVSVGNFRSEANVGFRLRYGHSIGASFGQLSTRFGQGENWQALPHLNWQLYLQGQVGYRFNDITIEGELPYVSNVTIQHQQWALSTGVIVPIFNHQLTWSMNAYSPSYDSAKDNVLMYASLKYGGTF